jgi:DNA invertase Pin-like site-specific DNA recombinase
MTGVLIGYARCSTDEQDLTAQRDRLRELGGCDGRAENLILTGYG